MPRAELWEVPEVREFFNLDAMDQGKSYAERAHATPGHGLRLVEQSSSLDVYIYTWYI